MLRLCRPLNLEAALTVRSQEQSQSSTLSPCNCISYTCEPTFMRVEKFMPNLFGDAYTCSFFKNALTTLPTPS